MDSENDLLNRLLALCTTPRLAFWSHSVRESLRAERPDMQVCLSSEYPAIITNELRITI